MAVKPTKHDGKLKETKERQADHKSERISASSEIVAIEQELTEVNPKLFDGVNKDKKRELLQTFTQLSITQKSHSGPLPDPETLIQYNSVIPNGADRIMIMAENQQNHRMKLESKAVGWQLFQSQLGQIFAFLICLVLIAAGVYLAMNDHEKTGIVLVGVTVSLVSIFALGKLFKKSKPSED